MKTRRLLFITVHSDRGPRPTIVTLRLWRWRLAIHISDVEWWRQLNVS